jgi:type I restriction enzyme R subunit
MFLTGFDSKTLNTLYVDKNLKYHGLIQAFSRTNRILNELKSQGNIVCFRNLKQATDDAIALFSNKDAKEIIIMQPYESYVETFNEKYDALKLIVPTVSSVSDLYSEEEKLEFIKAFRELLRVKNILGGFSDFKWDDLKILEQEFEDYMSKYLDLKPSINPNKEKVSILEDVDFELELIHKDEINVTYILKLLGLFKESDNEEQKAKQREDISNLLNNNPQLRSKRELIEKFIQENLPEIMDTDDIIPVFEKFWNSEQQNAFNQLITEENLSAEKSEKLIEN